MDTYQILNGDALLEAFPKSIPGQKIIMRECLIEGPVHPASLDNFFNLRANFFEGSYGGPSGEYHKKSLPEFQKMQSITEGATIYLWFEHDLFCQANLWFTLYLLQKSTSGFQAKIVYPCSLPPEKQWYGFGAMSTSDLETAFQNATLLSPEDLEFVDNLWLAYSNNDLKTLEECCTYHSNAFPQVSNAIKAHLDRLPKGEDPGRPKRVIQKLLNQYDVKDFGKIFRAFQKTEGIYGFGDLQVKAMVDSMV